MIEKKYGKTTVRFLQKRERAKGLTIKEIRGGDSDACIIFDNNIVLCLEVYSNRDGAEIEWGGTAQRYTLKCYGLITQEDYDYEREQEKIRMKELQQEQAQAKEQRDKDEYVRLKAKFEDTEDTD